MNIRDQWARAALAVIPYPAETPVRYRLGPVEVDGALERTCLAGEFTAHVPGNRACHRLELVLIDGHRVL